MILRRHRFWVKLTKMTSKARSPMNLSMTLGRTIFKNLRKKSLKCLKFKN